MMQLCHAKRTHLFEGGELQCLALGSSPTQKAMHNWAAALLTSMCAEGSILIQWKCYF